MAFKSVAKKIAMIAGPCSVEGEDQICRIAKEVKAAGADMLRGGAYKLEQVHTHSKVWVLQESWPW